MDETIKTIFLVFSGLLGAAVGSFLNVCIWRLPREGLSPARPRRSFCPSCATEIRWFDNLPIVSWLLLRGQCRDCRAPISARYTAVEALTAALFLLVAMRYLVADRPSPAGFVIVAALASALVVASFVDLELWWIPDEITLRGMLLAPWLLVLVPDLHARSGDMTIRSAATWLRGFLEAHRGSVAQTLGQVPWVLLASAASGALLAFAGYRLSCRGPRDGEPKSREETWVVVHTLALAGCTGMACVLDPRLLNSPRVLSLWAALAGMFTGASLVWLIGWVGAKAFRKPAMGLGDVKLMGLLGAFTGWLQVIEGFFLACILGSLVGIVLICRRRGHYIPFGPYLAAACLFMILFPGGFQALLSWYVGIFVGAGY
jgi:leader peptidase (prepilin peptidase)/N-methyltransferase